MPDRPTLLPPSASPLERAIEQATARIEDVPIVVATLWNPDTCDERWLGWLAWAMSVDVWQPEWSEESKRAAIRQSFAIHRHKGTIGAVRRALDTLGLRIDVSEWWQADYSGDPIPHTFRLDAFVDDILAAGFSVDHAFLDSVTRVIDSVKPLRSHMDRMRIGERFETGTHLRSGTRSRVTMRAEIAPMPRVNCAIGGVGMRAAVRGRSVSRIHHDILRSAA